MGGGGGGGRWRERVLGVSAGAGAGAVAGVRDSLLPATYPERKRTGVHVIEQRARLGVFCDFLTALLFTVMLVRTLRYIYRRKRGSVGPALQRVYLRYWVCHAFCFAVARLISLWLSPLRGPLGVQTALSVIRATACVSPLVLRDWLYDILQRSVYDAAEPQVETLLQTVRKNLHDVRTWCAAAGDEIVARYMVGGVSSVLASFRAEEGTTGGTRTLGETFGVGSTVGSSSGTGGGLGAGTDTGGVGDVSNGAVGAAVERSHVVHTKAEAPKAAYAASRSLRESFRQRAQARKNDAG